MRKVFVRLCLVATIGIAVTACGGHREEGEKKDDRSEMRDDKRDEHKEGDRREGEHREGRKDENAKSDQASAPAAAPADTSAH